MFGLFKRKSTQTAAVPRPIEVNVPAQSVPAVLRHLERIIRLHEAAVKPGISQERQRSLMDEAQRRKNQLIIGGVSVPDDLDEIRAMLDQVQEES